jgi:hypothetical protein
VRRTVLGAAIILFGFVAPPVAERFMTGAPPWVWAAASVVAALTGTLIILLSNPVHGLLLCVGRRRPVALVVFLVCGLVGVLAWRLSLARDATDQSLFIDCRMVALPVAVAPDTRLYALDAFPALLSGGLTEYVFGPDSAAQRWPSADSFGAAYRCEVKNYGESPFLGIGMPITLAFLKKQVDTVGRVTAEHDEIETTRDRRVEIPAVDPKGGVFVFYIWNQSDHFVEVRLPEVVTSYDSSGPRQVRLLRPPMATSLMTLGPHIEKASASDRIQRLITGLRPFASEPTFVEVLFSTVQQKAIAERVHEAFQLAGWQSSLVPIPTEALLNDKAFINHEGVEVEGNPNLLVDSVVRLLSEAGYQRVTAKAHDAHPPRSLRIYVGH